MIDASIFDIQGHSVHDGPGSRTAVFLAGCPLRCFWCCNPEGLTAAPSLLHSTVKCTHTHYRCVEACPYDAVTVADPTAVPRFDRSRCDACATFRCIDVCYSEALRIASRTIGVDELMQTLGRHRHYWGTDGGVTFTGGEPLMQPQFLQGALERCRAAYVHTALETSLHADWAVLAPVLGFVDFMFADIKHMEPECHRSGTGVDNGRILDNFRRISESDWTGRLVVRIPVVPGFNDDHDNIRATALFASRLGLTECNLLSLHRLGLSKYEQLHLESPLANIEPPGRELLEHLKSIVEESGMACYLDNETPF